MTHTPDPSTITVYVFSDAQNKFRPVRMSRVVCPECRAHFDTAGDDHAGMVWYNANRNHPAAGDLWIVECPCGEQFTSSDPDL